MFKADIKTDKSACLTIKELFFPVIYFAVNIFVSGIVSVVYKREEYGLMETKNTVEKYNYCKMTATSKTWTRTLDLGPRTLDPDPGPGP